MAAGDRRVRAARLYGMAFVVLFSLALTALLGELFGAFADSAESFTPYFDSSAERFRHTMGAYALAASGIGFLGFAVTSTANAVGVQEVSTEVQIARLTAAVFAALVGVAGASLATVSLSVGFRTDHRRPWYPRRPGAPPTTRVRDHHGAGRAERGAHDLADRPNRRSHGGAAPMGRDLWVRRRRRPTAQLLHAAFVAPASVGSGASLGLREPPSR